MIILDVAQGSDEWFAARAGIPTASCFKKIITSTGKPSKSMKDYAYQLVGEKILGRPEDSYTNFHMERGKEMEAEARDLYEFLTGNKVEQVGLCYRDESRQESCSPDGLIGEDGGVEIKCPTLHVHTKYLHGGKCPADYVPQVQGSLYITGRKWWDFMSYYPGMPELKVRVYPDQEFQKALISGLRDLRDMVNRIKKEISA